MVRVLCTISLVSYPVPHGLGMRLTIFDLHFVEPDWFATFDEQKAQKDAVYKLKVCLKYIFLIPNTFIAAPTLVVLKTRPFLSTVVITFHIKHAGGRVSTILKAIGGGEQKGSGLRD